MKEQLKANTVKGLCVNETTTTTCSLQNTQEYKCQTCKVVYFWLPQPQNTHTVVFSAFLLALIQSVNMEMTDEMVTCSSHNIYPLPQVTWATDPPSAQEALENSIIKTTDHKGLFTVESTLRILGNVSNYTYFCSFIAADKTQVWTASGKNQGVFQLHCNFVSDS